MRRHYFTLLAVAISSALLFSQSKLSPGIREVLNSIAPAHLKGDLSFLASDTLLGRYTPSPGLAVAAEFIASRFREVGLEPGGDHDYFQVAMMVDRHYPGLYANLIIQGGSETLTIPFPDIGYYSVDRPAHIENAPVAIFTSRDPDLLKGVDLRGKAVIDPQFDYSKLSQEESTAAQEKSRAFTKAIASSGAAIELILVRDRREVKIYSQLLPEDEAHVHSVPTLTVDNAQLKNWLDHPNPAALRHIASFDVPGPEDIAISVKNVIGILRGSDPSLNSTCLLLTAHYDHIGTTDTAGRMAMPTRGKYTQDHIYNGANDDGSGTVSVIEIARALARLNPHPKRSIVFIAFFGEERGERGSQYYASHPVFPIAKTIADVNLEQVGRTDSNTGRNLNSASLTGFDYSDVTKFLQEAGRQTGINVYLDKEASDAYFTRSDNEALARFGIPAHSLTVAFDFPDYHGLGDEWQKIDYDNMARVDRMIALGLIEMANSPRAPGWNAQNPKTAPFREAQQKSQRP